MKRKVLQLGFVADDDRPVVIMILTTVNGGKLQQHLEVLEFFPGQSPNSFFESIAHKYKASGAPSPLTLVSRQLLKQFLLAVTIFFGRDCTTVMFPFQDLKLFLQREIRVRS